MIGNITVIALEQMTPPIHVHGEAAGEGVALADLLSAHTLALVLVPVHKASHFNLPPVFFY